MFQNDSIFVRNNNDFWEVGNRYFIYRLDSKHYGSDTNRLIVRRENGQWIDMLGFGIDPQVDGRMLNTKDYSRETSISFDPPLQKVDKDTPCLVVALESRYPEGSYLNKFTIYRESRSLTVETEVTSGAFSQLVRVMNTINWRGTHYASGGVHHVKDIPYDQDLDHVIPDRIYSPSWGLHSYTDEDWGHGTEHNLNFLQEGYFVLWRQSNLSYPIIVMFQKEGECGVLRMHVNFQRKLKSNESSPRGWDDFPIYYPNVSSTENVLTPSFIINSFEVMILPDFDVQNVNQEGLPLGLDNLLGLRKLTALQKQL